MLRLLEKLEAEAAALGAGEPAATLLAADVQYARCEPTLPDRDFYSDPTCCAKLLLAAWLLPANAQRACCKLTLTLALTLSTADNHTKYTLVRCERMPCV